MEEGKFKYQKQIDELLAMGWKKDIPIIFLSI